MSLFKSELFKYLPNTFPGNSKPLAKLNIGNIRITLEEIAHILFVRHNSLIMLRSEYLVNCTIAGIPLSFYS